MADVAGTDAHAVGVAIEDERALAVAGIVRLVAARVKPRIGEQVALDAMHPARRQCARDLGDVSRRQRRIAAAAQDDVAVHDTVGVGLRPVERLCDSGNRAPRYDIAAAVVSILVFDAGLN